ncbi:MAG: hypothetical protein AB7T22_08975 [Calditrichaceae bacterium]
MQKPSEKVSKHKSFFFTMPGAIILAAVITAVFGIIGVMIVHDNQPIIAVQQEGSQQSQNSILSPINNEIVINPIRVEGTLSSYSEESFFWLAVQVGNLLWPKVEIRSTEFEWTKYVNEREQPGKRFGIVLIRIDTEGQRIVKNWFQEGDASGHYPGFEIVPNSETLDIVKVMFDEQ